jgi:hypothetical protein
MQMMRGAMKCMDCGGVKPGETVLISTDSNKLRIAEALAGAAYAVDATPIIVMIPPVKTHGAQLPEPQGGRCLFATLYLVSNPHQGAGGGHKSRETGLDHV